MNSPLLSSSQPVPGTPPPTTGFYSRKIGKCPELPERRGRFHPLSGAAALAVQFDFLVLDTAVWVDGNARFSFVALLQ